MNKREKIEQWAKELTADQMRQAIVQLVDFAIDAEEVSFHDLAPYWSNSGDALVEGQKTFSGDGE